MARKVPPLSYDLIQALDSTYPSLPPDPKDTEREIWMKAGERRLVSRLLELLRLESNSSLLDDDE